MPSKKKHNSFIFAFSALRRARHELTAPFIGVLVLVVGSALFAFFPSLLLRRIIDNYIVSGATAGLWGAALLFLAAYAIANAIEAAQSYLASVIGQKTMIELRMMLAEHMQQLPMSYYNSTPVGEIISRTTADVDAVSNIFSSSALNSLADLFRLGGIVAALYVISPKIAIISLTTIPFIFFLANYFRRNMLEAESKIRKSVGTLNAMIQEVFSGLKVIKSYGAEQNFVSRFQEPLANNVKVSNDPAIYVSVFPCATQSLRALIIAGIIWYAMTTGQSTNSVITLGGLAAIIDLIGKLLDPVEAISNEIQVFQQSISGLNRIAEVMSLPIEQRSDPVSLSSSKEWCDKETAISFTDVTFGYHETTTIINGISLQIP
ncbi:MAG: ABC transporter ATP-binding protein, partial [bacterium]|nr:ABC transporter ATP-binding protein [bacterium]